MARKLTLERIDPVRVRIPRDERLGMRTDVLAFASEEMIEEIRGDLSLEQAVNVATLPGIVGPSLAMPDIHQGYGFPASISTAACAWFVRRWKRLPCGRAWASLSTSCSATSPAARADRAAFH
jgi:hypothetical protein